MTLATKNEGYGFWGTIAHRVTDPARAWACASDQVALKTGSEPEAVRAFLDGRFGRHFADDVTNLLGNGKTIERAIAEAAVKWMEWKIGKRTSREFGIPVGLPYLTGMVEASAIAEENE